MANEAAFAGRLMSNYADILSELSEATPFFRRYARALGAGVGLVVADGLVHSALQGLGARLRAREVTPNDAEAARVEALDRPVDSTIGFDAAAAVHLAAGFRVLEILRVVIAAGLLVAQRVADLAVEPAIGRHHLGLRDELHLVDHGCGRRVLEGDDEPEARIVWAFAPGAGSHQ